MKQQRYIRRQSISRRSLILVSLLGLSVLAGAGQAQERYEPPPIPVDPTPLIKLLSEAERAALAKETSPKKQVEVYLRFSDTHLQAALAAINSDDHNTSERELDIYNKSLNEAAKIAFALPEDRRKTCKKVEQTIYKQLRMLETIDRRFPAERAGFIEYAVKNAKQVRGKALNYSFDSGEVITDPDKHPATKPPQGEKMLSSATAELAKWQLFISSLSDLELERLVHKVGLIRIPASMNPGQLTDDYLTEEEDDFVRQAQEPDLRVKVFMKIIDRRLKALTNTAPAADDQKAQ